MDENPLHNLLTYSQFISGLLNLNTINHSTVIVWSDSPYTGMAEGEVYFSNNIRLRMREEIDFDAGLISSYGYEVYRGSERLYWYDDFPHPNIPELAETFPHHKHIPPNIKENRIPAPDLSFVQPNLPNIIQEIEQIGDFS